MSSFAAKRSRHNLRGRHESDTTGLIRVYGSLVPRSDTVPNRDPRRSFIGAGPYGKRSLVVRSSRGYEAVRRGLQSERRWFRSLPPEGQYAVLGNLDGDRVRLMVMSDHREYRKLEFRGTIEPLADGGTQVTGVIRTKPGYRWFAVPAQAAMTLGLVTFLAFRIANGGSLLHPFFFTAVAILWLVGMLTAVVPALLGESFEGSADAILAFLEETVGGEVIVDPLVSARR